MRRVLAPLAAMADRLDLVVLVVMHLTKDVSTRLINRVSGAGAFVNAARSVLVPRATRTIRTASRGVSAVLVHVGSNWGAYAPTLAARIEAREVDLDDGSRTTIGHIAITGESDINVDDLQRGRNENAGSDVEEEILVALADGPRPSVEVKKQVVEKTGCGKRTVERAAERMRECGELTDSTSKASPGARSGRSPVAPNRWPTVAPRVRIPVAPFELRVGATDSCAVVTEETVNKTDAVAPVAPVSKTDVATGRTDVETERAAQANGAGASPAHDVAEQTGETRTLADATDAELLDLFPGSTIEHVDALTPADRRAPRSSWFAVCGLPASVFDGRPPIR